MFLRALLNSKVCITGWTAELYKQFWKPDFTKHCPVWQELVRESPIQFLNLACVAACLSSVQLFIRFVTSAEGKEIFTLIHAVAQFILPLGRCQISLHFADSCFGALKDTLNINHWHHGRRPLLPSTNTGYGIGLAESQFTTLVSIYLSIVIQQTYYNTARATTPSHLVGERNTWSITVQTMKTGPIKTLQLTHHTY